ncbi:hypothetical protein Tco_1145623 [Tanacetum coccineum]
MNTTQAQQKALDDSLVALAYRLEFGKCNMRLKTAIKPNEVTFQVVMDALALTSFYQAFLITLEVLAIYMQEHTGDITYLTDVNVDYLHQPWRAFATVINKCLSGKETGMDKIRVHEDTQVPDEQQQNVSGINEGVGVTPKVLDVPKYNSEIKEESCTFSQDDKDDEEESDKNDDSEETESDNDRDDLTHPNLSTYKADKEKEEEEKADDDEESSDQRVSTPPDYELTEEEEYKEDDDKESKQEEEEDDLYKDLNINLERSDAKMTNAQANQDMDDTHVTLTTMPLVVQQQSSFVSSDLVSKFINPSLDTGIDSILNQDTQSDTLVSVPVSVAAETPSSGTTIP